MHGTIRLKVYMRLSCRALPFLSSSVDGEEERMQQVRRPFIMALAPPLLPPHPGGILCVRA